MSRLRVVLCMGQFCNQGGRADPLYERLRDHLDDPKPAFMARDQAITWQTAACLSFCGGGPNLVIYHDDDTEGIWFHQLTPEALDAIIAEHLTPE